MIASAIRVANLGLYIFRSSIPMYTATLHLVTFFRGANTIKHYSTRSGAQLQMFEHNGECVFIEVGAGVRGRCSVSSILHANAFYYGDDSSRLYAFNTSARTVMRVFAAHGIRVRCLVSDVDNNN